MKKIILSILITMLFTQKVMAETVIVIDSNGHVKQQYTTTVIQQTPQYYYTPPPTQNIILPLVDLGFSIYREVKYYNHHKHHHKPKPKHRR